MEYDFVNSCNGDLNCTHLFFNREPAHRITLDEILNHPWLADAKSLKEPIAKTTPILQKNNVPKDLHDEIIATLTNGEI